jgi:phosphoribosylformylglycinamidine synthase
MVEHGLVRGRPPVLDLAREAGLHRVLVHAAAEGWVRSAHDCAEGGLAVTLAECAFDTGLGASVELPPVPGAAEGWADTAALFGESAGRVVLSVAPARVEALLAAAAAEGVPAAVIGSVGGVRLRVTAHGRAVIDESVAELEHGWATALGRHFARP